MLHHRRKNGMEVLAKLKGFLQRSLAASWRLAGLHEKTFRKRVHTRLHPEEDQMVVVNQSFGGVGQAEADGVDEIERQIAAAEIELEPGLSLCHRTCCKRFFSNPQNAIDWLPGPGYPTI